MSDQQITAPKPVQNDAFSEWLEGEKVRNITHLTVTEILAKYKELSVSDGDGWVRVDQEHDRDKISELSDYFHFIVGFEGTKPLIITGFLSEDGDVATMHDHKCTRYSIYDIVYYKPIGVRPQPPINK